MSGTLASSAGNVPTIPGGAGSGNAKNKRGCGCLGSITGAILLVLAVWLVFNPWALHMGGRWTPALTWHGVGKLHSSTGATYGLFMEVNLYMQSDKQAGYGPRQNLQGTAKLCTPQGEVYLMTVAGYVTHAWLDADGKPITFYLRSLKDAQPKLRMDLFGSWQGQELVLQDKGNMAMSFAADGNAKGYLQGQNAAKEDATGRLHYAAESEFATACGEKGKSSF
jgi:hypothetical protein